MPKLSHMLNRKVTTTPAKTQGMCIAFVFICHIFLEGLFSGFLVFLTSHHPSSTLHAVTLISD